MQIGESVRTSFEEIKAHPARSIFTLLGVPEGDLDEVAEAVVGRRGALENPRPVTAAEAAELLRSVW
mgnify:CR=1 FL=1